MFRPTFATIDLDALKYNLKTIKSLVPPEVDVLAIVKADAYGHGAVPVSRALINYGVKVLGVATVEEAIELRQAGISCQIVVMGGLMGMGGPAAYAMVEHDLTPVIHSVDVIDCLEEAVQKNGKKLKVHLKVDTGMSRLGVRPEGLPPLLNRLKTSKNLIVEGVMTHLAKAEEEAYTSFQLREFLGAKEKIEQELGPIDIWHISNSAAVIAQRSLAELKAKKLWVRPGIGLYGCPDGVKLPKGVVLKPVMGLESRVALLKHVPKGTAVSYGCTFVTKKPSRLGVVPIGYADGYRYSLTHKVYVLIRGRKVRVVGRVTMDMIIVDVTDVEKVSVGDEVILLGSQDKEKITVNEMAKWAGTISYEVFCGISKRIPRTYK